MEDNNQHIMDWIERYLDPSLAEEDRHLMDRQLAKDPLLKARVEGHRQLLQGIRHAHLSDKLTSLKELEVSLPEIESSEGRQTWMQVGWKPMAMAASVALLVMSYFLFRPAQNTVPIQDRLFTAYYEPFDSPGTGLKRGQPEDDVLTWKQKGYQAYDNGQYREAIINFQNALKKNDDPVVELCLGNAYLSLGQADKAEASFRNMLNHHEDLVTQAKWYLSLACLKQNKIELAKSSLWEISKSSTYGEKAKKLLKELD